MAEWLHDLRLAARTLWSTPRFTAFAALLLALGIGAGTTLFSIADAVLFRPLPFGDQDRLVVAGENLLEPRSEISWRDVEDWRARTRTFEALSAISSTEWTWDLRTAGDTVAVRYRSVSGNFFDLLGARPLIGRTFGPDDDHPGSARTVVLGHGFWQRQFGGDPDIVGRMLVFGGTAYTVVGIMPPAFAFPAATDAWTPLVPNLTAIAGAIPNGPTDVFDVAVLLVLGRLKPGVSIDTARQDLNEVIADLARGTGRQGHVEARVRSIVEEMLGPTRLGIRAWLAAVGLLLLVACANVTGLTLVRAARRSREYAVRLALGATRLALARQLFCESLMLSAIAGAAGVGLTVVALPVLVARLPLDIPRLGDAGVDLRVLSAAVVMALIASIVGSLAPALAVSRDGIEMLLRGSAASLISPARRARARRLLVATELCAAVVLLVAAGLLARSVAMLGELDLGFDRRGLLSVGVALPSAIDDAGARALLLRVLENFRQMPGVRAAAGVSLRPLHGPIGLDSRFRTDGQPPEEAAGNPYVNVETITPGYFRTMGTMIVEGRAFTDADVAAAMPVLVVSRSFARLAWPGQNPIGRRLQVAAQDRGPGATPTFRTVVGVAEDIRYRALETHTPTIYAPFAQSPDRIADFMVRTDTAAAVAPALRRLATALNGGGLVMIDDMDQVVSRLETPWRSNFILFVAFAGLTVLMAGAGLYTMLTHAVTSQAREIGVRVALGATPARVARRVIGDAARLVALGAVAGLLTAIGATRLIASLLFDVSPLDPVALGAAPLLLALVALAATVPPAVRASRTDPAVTLRGE